jgi:ectoine hydroxylase-related dioxygenase (phytanoyl-CoA dioxygenase family)
LIYLTPISQHAGGTVVWPGSHRQLESIARSRPEDFEFLYALNEEIAKVPLRNPVEILTEAGDVLFYHYLCAHAGSTNTGDTVRLALNHKW